MTKSELISKLKNSEILFSKDTQFRQYFYSKITLDEIVTILEKQDIVSVTDSKIIVLSGRHKLEIKVSKLLENKTPQDSELVTHLFRSYDKKYKLLIKRGKDCHKYFLNIVNNWDEKVAGNHHLKSDCMRYEQSQEYFKIYEENPEAIQVLYIFEGDNLKGHCTLYSDKYYDRIYAFNIQDFINIEKYLLENNYTNIWYLDKNSTKIPKLTLQLKKSKFEKYPYMDTFHLLDLKTNTLHTNKNIILLDKYDSDWNLIKPKGKNVRIVQALRSTHGEIDHTTYIKIN